MKKILIFLCCILGSGPSWGGGPSLKIYGSNNTHSMQEFTVRVMYISKFGHENVSYPFTLESGKKNKFIGSIDLYYDYGISIFIMIPQGAVGVPTNCSAVNIVFSSDFPTVSCLPQKASEK